MTRQSAGNAMKKFIPSGKIPIMQDPSQRFLWIDILKKLQKDLDNA